MFVHLHGHSIYSTLDGLSKIDDLILKAKNNGMNAFAITDHASITCLDEFYTKANEAGIKPIFGVEFYVKANKEVNNKKNTEKRYHLIVIAKNWEGIISINKMLTCANKFFYKKPIIDWEDALNFQNCIITTACSSGVLSHPDYLQIVKNFKEVYQDDFYLELMPLNVFYAEENDDKELIDQQKKINLRALELSKKLNIKHIFTNDYHFVDRDDYETHEVLLAIQRHTTMDNPKRWKFDTADVYFKTEKEMLEACFNLGYLDEDFIIEGIYNTQEIADKCSVTLPKFDFDLPSPYTEDEAIFAEKIKKGWDTLIKPNIPLSEQSKYQERLNYEIDIIKKLGFMRYFLIVEDIINFAKSKNILTGYARGSAAGSLVAYLLRITSVDPIRFGLFFERFLNPERVSMPDIDLDFEDARRDEIFQYIIDKYGVNKTAKVSTITVMHGKTAFRDVCRVYGITPLEINVLSKLIDDTLPIKEAIENNFILKQFCNKYPIIYKHTLKLDGVVKAVGVHAAGIVISANDLTQRCVIEYRKDISGDATFVTNWDKNMCEKYGLLKIDILGLSSLSIVSHAMDLIKQRHGKTIDMFEVSKNLNDEAVFEEFLQGNSVGIFQFETGGMQKLLRDIRVDNFEKLYHATALYRPGSLDSGETQKYIDIVNKVRQPEYYNSSVMKEILGETYSILIFQEQMMSIFNKISNFTLSQSDTMRKIVGKKLGVDEFMKYEKQFIDGCKEKNIIDETTASNLFRQLKSFADYSFNKSHAVSYTLLSYFMMYLKVYYPLEFFTALLSSNRDKKIKFYVREAKRCGINVDLPDVNYSGLKFTIKGSDSIVAPLTAIKGIGIKIVENVVYERDKNGYYKSYEDFLNRIYKRVVHKGVQDLLFRGGALRSLGLLEQNEEKKLLDYISLVSIYDIIPSVFLVKNKIEKDIILYKYNNIKTDKGEVIIYPTTSAKPTMLVITTPSISEGSSLDADGKFRIMWHKSTKWFYDLAKRYGFNKGDFYITSGIKKAFATKSKYDPSLTVYQPINEKQHLEEYQSFLLEEIEMVNPCIIMCFSGRHIKMLMGEDISMSDLSGSVEWSPIFKKPIAFSYSPQYCFYQSEESHLDNMFNAIMSIIKK